MELAIASSWQRILTLEADLIRAWEEYADAKTDWAIAVCMDGPGESFALALKGCRSRVDSLIRELDTELSRHKSLKIHWVEEVLRDIDASTPH